MRIIYLAKSQKPHGVEVKAIMSDVEFAHLEGRLENLCLFSTEAIKEPATATRTGAKHNAVKWLLFPATLRKKFKADDFDFEKVTCGTIKYRDKVYVIYAVSVKGTFSKGKQAKNSDDEPYYQSVNGNP